MQNKYIVYHMWVHKAIPLYDERPKYNMSEAISNVSKADVETVNEQLAVWQFEWEIEALTYYIAPKQNTEYKMNKFWRPNQQPSESLNKHVLFLQSFAETFDVTEKNIEQNQVISSWVVFSVGPNKTHL